MSSVLALDVGEQRVGIAIARQGLQVAVPLTTLERQAADFWEKLLALAKQNDVSQLVIGLPRGLDGQETAQTAKVQSFAEEVSSHLDLPVIWQDEAVTSVKAEEILKNSGQAFAKADIDATAASLILTDYLEAKGVKQ